MLRDRRAQTMASGVVALLLLLVLAAALVDGLHLLSLRQRCLEVASAAALRGVSRGRDYARYLSAGHIALHSATAHDEAYDAANAGLAALGLSGYAIRVEVLDAPAGGSMADFPPGRTWSETEPAAGVYLEVPVDTVFVQALTGSGPVVLHVFAAAGVATQ
jgi:Flp pilus assembly protein TadG